MLIDYSDTDRDTDIQRIKQMDYSCTDRDTDIQTIKQMDYMGTDRDTDIQTVIQIDHRYTDRDTYRQLYGYRQRYRQTYRQITEIQQLIYIDRSQIYRQRYRHTDNYIDRLQSQRYNLPFPLRILSWPRKGFLITIEGIILLLLRCDPRFSTLTYFHELFLMIVIIQNIVYKKLNSANRTK